MNPPLPGGPSNAIADGITMEFLLLRFLKSICVWGYGCSGTELVFEQVCCTHNAENSKLSEVMQYFFSENLCSFTNRIISNFVIMS